MNRRGFIGNLFKGSVVVAIPLASGAESKPTKLEGVKMRVVRLKDENGVYYSKAVMSDDQYREYLKRGKM
jgi:hypothetical protein